MFLERKGRARNLLRFGGKVSERPRAYYQKQKREAKDFEKVYCSMYRLIV